MKPLFCALLGVILLAGQASAARPVLSKEAQAAIKQLTARQLTPSQAKAILRKLTDKQRAEVNSWLDGQIGTKGIQGFLDQYDDTIDAILNYGRYNGFKKGAMELDKLNAQQLRLRYLINLRYYSKLVGLDPAAVKKPQPKAAPRVPAPKEPAPKKADSPLKKLPTKRLQGMLASVEAKLKDLDKLSDDDVVGLLLLQKQIQTELKTRK